MSEHSEQLNELAKALAVAQGEFPKIAATETGKVQGEGKKGAYEYTYKYADLAGVVETVQPILSKHGLSVAQFISVTESGKDTLTTWLMHESGQFITSSMRLYLKKDDSQAQGSAVTYARRYSYCAALGLVVDEDDDGQRATAAKVHSSPSEPKTTNSKQKTTKKANPETGELEHNLQPKMLDEIKGADRPKFLERFGSRYKFKITAVPDSHREEVEKFIGEWSAGRPFAGATDSAETSAVPT
jgi:hypothetical protein